MFSNRTGNWDSDVRGNRMKKQENWYFSFGSGQAHDGCYIKLSGTFEEARQQMVEAR